MRLQSSEAPYPNRRYRPTKLSRPAETKTTKEIRAENRWCFLVSRKTGLIWSTACKQLVPEQDVGKRAAPGCGGAANPRQTLLFTSMDELIVDAPPNETIKPVREQKLSSCKRTQKLFICQ